jgi:purine nucleosidase
MTKRMGTILFLVVTPIGAMAFAQNYPSITPGQRIEMLQPAREKPVRMVFDTDTYNEIDDQFALVYALISPELDVQAVYAAPFHNHRSTGPADGMEKSYEEILRVLDKLDRSPDAFAFKGSTRYLTDLKKPERSPAVTDLIERAKQASPGDPLYVAAVGAITNVSNAILIEPSIVRNIVVWLGGNGHHWPHQREFNFRQDLNASRVSFDNSRHLIRAVNFVHRDPIFRDFFTKLDKLAKQ